MTPASYDPLFAPPLKTRARHLSYLADAVDTKREAPSSAITDKHLRDVESIGFGYLSKWSNNII